MSCGEIRHVFEKTTERQQEKNESEMGLHEKNTKKKSLAKRNLKHHNSDKLADELDLKLEEVESTHAPLADSL